MTARECRYYAALFAAVALVSLGATVWTAIDLASQPFTWPPVGTVAIGVVETAGLAFMSLWFRRKGRKAAQKGGQS